MAWTMFVHLVWRTVLPSAVVVMLTACGIGGTVGGVPNVEQPDIRGEPSLSSLIAGHNLYDADEFAGPADSEPEEKFWTYNIGGGGWESHERQTYTYDIANVRVDGHGSLVIEARQTADGITSGRLTTEGKVELTNGLVAARIKLPAGRGLHPAFWMLGTSIADVGWPRCGEIDIIETLNEASSQYFTIIGPPVAGQLASAHFEVQSKTTRTDVAGQFHTYWLYKQPDKLVMGIDDKPVARFTPDQTFGTKWIWDQPYFVLLNLAVGGDWPGPLGTGVLPQQMVVDWVRFYR